MKRLNERWHIIVGNCFVMDFGFCLFGQALCNTSDGIFTVTKTRCLRPIENCPDPLANAPRGLLLRQPDGRENAQNVGSINLIDTVVAEVREGVLC